MKIIISFFIFCIVLFIYLHVHFQLRTSDDLEVYELDEASKNKLEEICDLRQPVLFDYDNQQMINSSNKDYVFSNYSAFEIKVRNVKETNCNYLPLQINDATKLFDEDKNQSYFSENNTDFLQETGVIKAMQYNDEYLRPYMVSNCNYDVMIGSEGTVTPFRYEINYRTFFTVTQGSIKIKLTPPKNSKYLEPISDYENFEFSSLVNPWTTNGSQNKYKCLEVLLNVGKTIYIPAYWWYSIQFEKNTSISCFRYRTYMNNIAIIPNICMYALQNQNIKRDLVKKVEKNIKIEKFEKNEKNNIIDEKIEENEESEENNDTKNNLNKKVKKNKEKINNL